MEEASSERQALTDRINRLEFREYGSGGWFKAVTLRELRGYIDKGGVDVFDRYAAFPADPSSDRELIRLFLAEWLLYHHPESMTAFALNPATFRPIDRTEALAVADRIVAISLNDPRDRIGGCLEWLKPASPEEAVDVPYPQLWTWFSELFGKGCRFHLLEPYYVIGFAPDVIGMLWLE